MKTANTLKFIMVVATIGLLFTSCKKNEDVNPASTSDDLAQQTQSANDQTKMENESDNNMDEVVSIIDGISQVKSMQNLGCNVTIDSSMASMGQIKLTFNGTNCAGTLSRSGIIKVQFPYDSNTQTVTRFHEAGCIITLTYQNFAITTLSDNKTFTYNGTRSITNISGGRISQIIAGTPIIHKIRANMQLTFDDGTTRNWGAARMRKFMLSNDNILSVSIDGDTTINNYSNSCAWGVNRAGQNFVISITTPIDVNIAGSTCLYKPLSGVKVHHLEHDITVTFGVDSNGNAVTNGDCPYGFKANWVNANGVAKQVIRPY